MQEETEVERAFDIGARAMNVRLMALAEECKDGRDIKEMILNELNSDGHKKLNRGGLLTFNQLGRHISS